MAISYSTHKYVKREAAHALLRPACAVLDLRKRRGSPGRCLRASGLLVLAVAGWQVVDSAGLTRRSACVVMV